MVHISLTYLEHISDKTHVKHIFKNSKFKTYFKYRCSFFYCEHMRLFMFMWNMNWSILPDIFNITLGLKFILDWNDKYCHCIVNIYIDIDFSLLQTIQSTDEQRLNIHVFYTLSKTPYVYSIINCKHNLHMIKITFQVNGV